MPLILAIESDRRQAARISSLARERLNVELLVADSAERALLTLAHRTPDLILTPQLMSPKDEAALDERLRELDSSGSHVQTLMIPVLASSGRRGGRNGGLLNRLRRSKDDGPSEGGCDPAVFAAQIAEYLERAADERAAQAVLAEDKRSIAEDKRAYQASVVVEEIPRAVPDAAGPALSEFSPERAQPEASDGHVAFSVDEPSPVAAAPEFDEPLFDAPSSTFAAPAVEHRAFYEPPPIFAIPEPEEPVTAVEETAMRSEAPMSLEAEPAISMEESGLAGFGDFVEFEELTIVDAPSIGFGELISVVQRMETEALEATTVLDALEILAEPEIPTDFDLQSEEQAAPPERPVLAFAQDLPNEPEPDPRTSGFDFEGDLWMPLPVIAHRRWPALQGPTVKAILTPAFDAPPDADVEFAPPPETPERVWGKKRSKSGKPKQDEWGFFDPVQCGFAALLAKLDEVTDKEDSGDPKAGR